MESQTTIRAEVGQITHDQIADTSSKDTNNTTEKVVVSPYQPSFVASVLHLLPYAHLCLGTPLSTTQFLLIQEEFTSSL